MEKNIPTYASTLWDELDGKDLEDLFEKRPRFAEMYDWSQLSGKDWYHLLEEKPQFADRCDWEKLCYGYYNWTRLLQIQPQVADKCDWSKISKEKRAGLKLRLGK